MLELTESAQRAVREMVEEAELGAAGGLRIASVGEPGGDVELEFELVEDGSAGDEFVESGGARVYLDEVAAEALTDMRIEVEEHGDHVHFSLEDQQS